MLIIPLSLETGIPFHPAIVGSTTSLHGVGKARGLPRYIDRIQSVFGQGIVLETNADLCLDLGPYKIEILTIEYSIKVKQFDKTL